MKIDRTNTNFILQKRDPERLYDHPWLFAGAMEEKKSPQVYIYVSNF